MVAAVTADSLDEYLQKIDNSPLRDHLTFLEDELIGTTIRRFSIQAPIMVIVVFWSILSGIGSLSDHEAGTKRKLTVLINGCDELTH
jgi:hypothetical protein